MSLMYRLLELPDSQTIDSEQYFVDNMALDADLSAQAKLPKNQRVLQDRQDYGSEVKCPRPSRIPPTTAELQAWSEMVERRLKEHPKYGTFQQETDWHIANILYAISEMTGGGLKLPKKPPRPKKLTAAKKPKVRLSRKVVEHTKPPVPKKPKVRVAQIEHTKPPRRREIVIKLAPRPKWVAQAPMPDSEFWAWWNSRPR